MKFFYSLALNNYSADSGESSDGSDINEVENVKVEVGPVQALTESQNRKQV